MKKREIGTIFLIALIGAILLFPLFGLVFEYLLIHPGKGLRLFWRTLVDPLFLSALRFTLWQASLSVIGSLLLGIPAAWLLAKHRIPGKGLIYALLTLPMMLPVIMAVLSFVILYGENGLLNEFIRFLGKVTGREFPQLELLYSMRGILLCHLFYNAPIVAKIVGRAWERLGIAEEEAAVTLGASPWRCWWSVTLPKLTPAILSAAAITFVFCFTSFAIPLILGGKPSLATLEVLIFEQARLFLNLPRAIALSLIELSIVTLFFFLSSSAYEHADVDLLPSRIASRLPAAQLSALRFVSLIGIALFFSLLVFSPLAAMLVAALREMMHPSTVSSVFTSWEEGRELAFVIGKAAKTSFTVASLSALISTAAGGVAAYLVSRLSEKRRWLDHLALLPAAISGIVIGMGYLKYYHGVVEEGGLLGWLAFALLHSAVNFPFAYRIISPQCRQITASIVDASSLLGASRFQLARSILLPLLRPALINSVVLTFALSLGEFTATSMLYSEELRTIPILIYQLIGSYRLREASILGAVFLGIALFVFWLLERGEIEEIKVNA